MDNVNAYALALQCRCVHHGWGKTKFPFKVKACDLWRLAEKRAMEQRNGRALYELFLLGKLFQIDSFYLLRPAAEAGDIRACFELGRRYLRGLDVPVDREEAQFWLQKAAFRGYPSAQYDYLLGLKPWLLSTDDEKNRFFLWLEKTVQVGNTHAGIRLGECRTFVGTTGIRTNWQEGERLFRRFCPLAPQRGYTDRIIKHFLEKPATKRSERDRRFLGRVRDYLRDNEPQRAARLFQLEAPDFATECAALAGKRFLKEDDILIRTKELETSLSKAESDWISENEELRRRAGETFIKWARYLSSPAGRNYVRAVRQPTHQQNVENMIALFARCSWRAAQTLLLDHPLTTDTKKSIDFWIKISLQPYRLHMDDSMASTSCPSFVREAAFFCCRNTNQIQELGLSFDTIMLGHEVAVLCFDDKNALKWLIENNADGHLRWSSRYIYLQKAVDEKIPLALRIKADQLSARSQKIGGIPGRQRQLEIEQLLREAAAGGDAEAQCRQGEMLLKDKSQAELREQARDWFLKAAGKGHERAAMQLGTLFAEENSDEALRWLEQVAKNPYADASLRTSAECELGKLCLQRQQLSDAANHLRIAAESNNRAAMKLLALDPGLRGVISDEEIGKWCLSLLDQESTDSQNDTELRGQLLTRLGQVAKSKSESADWFRKAAEAGDGPGAYEWARCLMFGDGCDRDLPEAEKWFRTAWDKCKETRDETRDLASFISSWSAILKTSPEVEPITQEEVENGWQVYNREVIDEGNQ